MTTLTSTVSVAEGKLLPVVAAAMLGLAIIFTTGHIQVNALHDAAHDVRHSTGFPCH